MASPAVVFDLGKVLVDFDYSIVGRRVAARSNLGAAEVQNLLDHSPLLFRYETGHLNNEQFFGEVRSATGFRGDISEFSSLFADIFSPMDEMVALHAELRSKKIPTYIFSNTNDFAVTHIRQRFPFFSLFDGYVLSYQQGAMKPDATIYAVVEKVTNRKGPDLIYLDDRAENVDAGTARGWRTILHSDPSKSRAMLKSFGLPV